MPGLPARRAGLDGSDPWARFEEWRRALDSLFDCAPVEETPAAFHGELVGYQLDPVLLGASRASAQRFHRDEARIAAAGVDHLLIQLYQSGRVPLMRMVTRPRGGRATSSALICPAR